MRDLGKFWTDAAKSEALNMFGLMEGAYLNVSVLSARSLSEITRSPTALFCAMQCEGWRVETQEAPASFEPIWNEHFVFKIKRGDDPLDVSLCTKDFL